MTVRDESRPCLVLGTGAEQRGVGIEVDNATVVDIVRMKVCGLSRGDAQEAVEDAAWSLPEAAVVREAQGGVYPICLCPDVCVSGLALFGLTGLPSPPPFSQAHPHSASPSQLPLLCLAPPSPPGLEQSGGSSRPGGQLLRCQQDVPAAAELGPAAHLPGGGGPERLLETGEREEGGGEQP